MIKNILLAAAASVVMVAAGLSSTTAASAGVKNVVLVHGAFADGSGWKGVYDILKKDGYNVSVVQHPTISLADDAAITKRAIDQFNGPVVLVGHSYGGVVISEAGNDKNVKSLVYIAAFAPEKGESVASLGANAPKDAPVPPFLPPVDGFISLDKSKFATAFAADVDPATAEFMANAQLPVGLAAITGTATNPAWKHKPSFYLVAADDRMIPPAAQRLMAKRAGATVVEVPGSHAIYVSNPKAVADLIEKAAEAAK